MSNARGSQGTETKLREKMFRKIEKWSAEDSSLISNENVTNYSPVRRPLRLGFFRKI